MEKYLTRKVEIVKEFHIPGTFQSKYAAERWLYENGYSTGSSCAMMPTPIMKGEYSKYDLPQKWKNFTSQQKSIVHGVMVGDQREGPVFVRIFSKE